MRSSAIRLATVLVLAACSANDLSPGPGLLVVIGDDGDLVTMTPDGSDRTPLTDDAGPRRAYAQPTWAPAGDRLAWVEIRGDEEPGTFALASTSAQVRSSIRISRPDGSEPAGVPTPFIPFYLMWDPGGRRIAYLGNDETGVGLGMADPATGTADRLDAGTPFYLSWAPDGERLLTHVGTDRLDLLSLSGDRTAVAAPGSFRAPAWSAGGVRAYVVRDNDRERLVLDRGDGTVPETVADIEGFAALVLSPDGSRVAYVDSFPSLGATFGDLFVAGDSSPTPVAPDGVVAFFWSPTGERLLYLRADGAAWLRWGVWSGGETVEFGRFRPSEVLALQYLPFFDQYAQSLTFWSPAGDEFVYAGSDEAGRAGIWVQPVKEGSLPRLLGPGVFAAWSPQR